MSTTASLVADLELRSEIIPDRAWSRDLVDASVRLLESGRSMVRDAAGAIVVVANTPMRELSQLAQIGNSPVEFLTGRAAERVRQTTGAAVAGIEHDPFDHFLRYQLFTMNPPLHTDLRRVVTRQLMPRALLQFADVARQLFHDIMDEAAGVGVVDFNHDIAAKYTARFWCVTLGVGMARADEIQRLMGGMNHMFHFAPTAADAEHVRSSTARYLDLVRQAVKEAWERGENALLDGLASGLGDLDVAGLPEDIGTLVGSNFFDAFHTVALALANATYYLLSNPGAHEQVAADPTLVAAAFAEGTRLASPLMLTTRMALDDVNYDGLAIPAGTPVTMVWAAGNRDPEAFDDPHRYRLDRGLRLSTTFGGGAHICPGRNAAKMLSEIALGVVTGSDFEVELVGDRPEWVPDVAVRYLRELPVRVRAASAW